MRRRFGGLPDTSLVVVAVIPSKFWCPNLSSVGTKNMERLSLPAIGVSYISVSFFPLNERQTRPLCDLATIVLSFVIRKQSEERAIVYDP